MTDILTPKGFPDVKTLSINDKNYPQLLRGIPDAPQTLFITAQDSPEKIFDRRPTVAIVGTRDPSPYGRYVVTQIIQALAERKEKPLVVSGLALGIDGLAHRAALEAGLPTLAVMPTGPDVIYPYIHTKLAREIALRPGSALLTDFPAGTEPMAINFLRRNHIIAGLTQLLILVESKEKGGAILTARIAHDYGRDVLAVPGRIDDYRSQGCNRLIREGVATMLHDINRLTSWQR